MILVGELSLWVALLLATWAAIVSFAGGMQGRADLIASGSRGIHATLAMLLLASIGLWTALTAHDLSFAHVASSTAANLPLVYTLAAFWGGPAGALLLFALLLSAWATALVVGDRRLTRQSLPYVTGTLAVVLAFAVAVLCLRANPYARLDWGALDGRGMNPLLQSAGMILHPPTLYAGLACTAVPFALAIAGLVTGRLDGEWLAAARRWVVAGWLLLTMGIVLGMWWAYAQPDWDGEWTRDALGNAALFPWLVNTVLLHSLDAREGQRSRGKWNVLLLLSAFPLALFSAFLARGGIISTAHSFARSPVTGWFAGFMVLAVAVSTYLLLFRLHLLEAADEPRAASLRARRRPGIVVVYAGIALVLVALAGQALREEHRLTLGPGATGEVRDSFGRMWRLTSQGVSQYNELNRSVVAAAVEVGQAGSGGGIVTSESRQYLDGRGTPTFEPVTTAGILGGLEQDVYVTVTEVGDDETMQLRVAFNPLVLWVWIAGFILAIGGALLLFETAWRRSE
ncbi:MAG: cytochrome c biogenesis protein CcsA [Gemmatimonadaceae bacterium]